MHDIVIRGGSIIDGTGRPAFTGDLAIENERITAVGGKAGQGRRVIDADGLLVTPGWVDVHTHYDGQATWDPILASSSWHGVTTILFGNCGVGFAPVRPHHRDALIDLMEGVEDIPGPVLAEGLKWDWQGFPDFLDALERMPRTIDVAAQIPHYPLRVYVMGERAICRPTAHRYHRGDRAHLQRNDGRDARCLRGDWRERWLVERGVEIISEASRHLTDDLKARHPEIPWSKVAAIGHVLR